MVDISILFLYYSYGFFLPTFTSLGHPLTSPCGAQVLKSKCRDFFRFSHSGLTSAYCVSFASPGGRGDRSLKKTCVGRSYSAPNKTSIQYTIYIYEIQ